MAIQGDAEVRASGGGGGGGSAAMARTQPLPIRGDTLAGFSDCMQRVLDEWRLQRAEEHQWEMETLAAYDGGLHNAVDLNHQLKLADHLYWIMSLSAVFGGVYDLETELDDAEERAPDTRRWPRSRRSLLGKDVGKLLMAGVPARKLIFMHLSPGQVSRVRELLAEAFARIERIDALEDELFEEIGEARRHGAPTWALQTPFLLQRLHRMQRLTDDVFVPLRQLKSLVDDLNLQFDGRREPHRIDGQDLQQPRPLARPISPLQRSASI